MTRILSYIVHTLFGLFALLPMRVLYAMSSGVYYLLYYVTPYRRDVVKFNIYYSFPEKSKAEKDKLIKDFYRHFCDIFFEIIAMNGFKKKKSIVNGVRATNLEVLDIIEKSDKPVILVSGHLGNWEIPAVMVPQMKPVFLAVYKPFKNKVFNVGNGSIYLNRKFLFPKEKTRISV